jgi:hypothetical protein
MRWVGDDSLLLVAPQCKVGVTRYMRDARMANAMMTPINRVPTPDITRLRLRHHVAF